MVDGVGALHTAFDAGGNALASEVQLDVVFDLPEKLFVLLALGFDFADQLGIGVGLEVFEREVLQLAADFTHAETVRDGSVDFDGFLGDALLPFARERIQGAHVVQAIGELDDNHADVGHHGQQHLADAFGLPVFARVEVEFTQLGDAIHAAGHLIAEFLADLVEADAGVLDRVMQQAGFQAHHVDLHFGEDGGHVQRVQHVRLARGAELALVRFGRKLVGSPERRYIVFGAEFPHPALELGIELLDDIERGDNFSGHYLTSVQPETKSLGSSLYRRKRSVRVDRRSKLN